MIILLLVLVTAAGYVIYDNLPRKAVPFAAVEPFVNKSLPVNYSKSIQFYPNMRFRNERISYGFEERCNLEKRDNVISALALLENETRLSFYEASDNPEINIACSKLPPESKNEGHFIAGEGGPTEIINGSAYAIILFGKISLYRNETCDNPNIALHEILHVLGFDHNDNPLSILYPTLDCKQKLDDYMIDEIERVYSAQTLPDLTINKIEGNKSGKYASFEIVIENMGLADAVNSSVSLFADGRFVRDFALDTIPLGARKILTVSNINIGRRTEALSFEVDANNRITELQEDNNVRNLELTATS